MRVTVENVAPSAVMFTLKSIASISGGINFSWRRKKHAVRQGDNGSLQRQLIAMAILMSLISCIHYAIGRHFLLKTNCSPIKRISVGLIEDCCDYFVVSGSGFHIRQRAKVDAYLPSHCDSSCCFIQYCHFIRYWHHSWVCRFGGEYV